MRSINQYEDAHYRTDTARCSRWRPDSPGHNHDLGSFQHEVMPFPSCIRMKHILSLSRSRTLYFGLLEFMWALAGGVGPILGGVLSELVSWRWIFWVNLPISGTAFVLLLLFLDVHNPRTKIVDGIKAIDWFGSLSILAFTLMLLLGLDFGGATFPWNSPTVLCLIIFGGLISVFFIFSEKRLARYPLIPLNLFHERSNVACLLVAFLHGFVSAAPPYALRQPIRADVQRPKLPQNTIYHYIFSLPKRLLHCIRACIFCPLPSHKRWQESSLA